ncbi:MAG: glycosyltransferase family 2 protein [Thermoguttaceae bacterium]
MKDENPILPARPLPEGLWIVIAAYNEHRRIGAVLDDLLQLVKNIVVVDDGSRDGTAGEVLKRPVWLARHTVNLGQGAALQTGIAFALQRHAEYVVTFDADGQHCTTDLPMLIERLTAAGADFALGSRFLGNAEGIPWSRKLMLRMAVLFTRVFSGVALTDAHNGLRAMTRRGAEHVRLTMNRMEHASEIIDQIARSGLKYVEMPVTIRYTADSLAKGQETSAALRLGVKLLLEKVIR